MKKRYIVLMILMFSFAFKNSTIDYFPLFGKTILIDVGHGDEDPGSVIGENHEKDYNLMLAKTLSTTLTKNGATVVLIRDGDYDLASPSATHRKKNDFNNRIKLINQSSGDLFISLHMNYLNATEYHGAQVFYSKVNSSNQTIAEILQENLNTFLNTNKETKSIGDDKYMYDKIKITGVLLEYGFISNAQDRLNIKSEEYRKNLSEVITNALITYFT